MRSCVIAVILLFVAYAGMAQVGNEWINYTQHYLKIPVATEGLYRLSYADLITAGVPVSVDPKTFQLFHRGDEQAILVTGEDDSQFAPSDYIEFYGKGNDGTSDTELYNDPSSQPHTLYNLYNDTTAYFLTFGAAQGKRIALSQPVNPGLPAETYHWDEKLLILKSQYSGGIDYGEIQNTAFEEGEGWMGNQIIQNQTASYIIEGIVNGVTAAEDPVLEILLTGRGPMNHAVDLYAGSRLLTTLTFSGYQSHKHTHSLEWSDIAAGGKLTIAAKVTGSPDRVSVGYIRIRYPQKVDMNGASDKLFTLAENTEGTSYIEIENPPAGTRLFDVTDPAGIKRIATTQTTTLNATVASTSSSRKIVATSSFITPSIKKVSFRSIDPAAHNYVIITHPSLRKPASGYTDPVKAYAEYRALPQGGGFDTLIVNIDQLYNQFNYGAQSPLAIFHFMKYLASVNAPDYLFMVGKGLNVTSDYYRKPESYAVYKDLVPTAGYPASDVAFTAGLNGEDISHGTATGRLTAMGPQDVAAYLNKVKELEALPFNDLRRKNILHLSGGINPGEPQLFRSYLEQFAAIAKTFHLGGQVKAIAKQSTDIELINVAEEVNKGVNLITFFGHSSAASSDFDIGYVTDPVMGYNNKGKYPVLLMNGCSAGSFFLNASIFGENWVNSSNKGAIGVIAHSYFGFAFTLRNYSELFYQVAFADATFVNGGIGDVLKEVAKRYSHTFGGTPDHLTQIQQMVLLGDPAIKLFGAEKPDYEIKEEHVSVRSFDGEPVTALMDSFKLNFIVNNFGRAEDEDLTIAVTRTLNNGTVVEYDSTLSSILYSDTISFTIPGKIENGFGTNTFSIDIDAGNSIEELREDNNVVSFQYFIPLNGTRNLFPDNYAIVNSRNINLSFQHTDMRSSEREFVLELDTTETFNSAFKKEFIVKGTVLATQGVALAARGDTLAYYWRTKLLNALPNESEAWDVSSFTYIKDGSPGWAQVDFPQYGGNPSVGLIRDPLLKKITFEETVTDVAIRTFGSAQGYPEDSVSFRINDLEYNIFIDGGSASGCRNNTINFVAFDKTTTQPYPGIFLAWYEIQNEYGGRKLICGREPYVINSFTAEELTLFEDAGIIKYVDNIAPGDSVILFTIGDARFADWPSEAKQKLGELGISETQIGNLLPGEPVVIFARKGTTPGAAKIYRDTSSPVTEQKIEINETVTGRLTAGLMHSTVIGPALNWNSFFVTYNETESSDKISFDVTGIKLNGDEVPLKAGLIENEDLSDINAGDFPYLRISFNVEDDTYLTAVQLDKWLVTYEPVAEGLLLYRGAGDKQSVFEGQVWNGDFNFINISNNAFTDSLTVKYDIVNPETFVTTQKTMQIQAPVSGDTTKFVVPFTTVGHGGLNNLQVFVNPHMLPEQNYENNFIVFDEFIEVKTDGEAPVLDVTFDGRHILKNDFVSSTPDIHIMLWDNNPYLLKKDTTGVNIFITYPCDDGSCAPLPVYFSQQNVSWQPETDTSEFTVNVKPEDLPDGTYSLRVEAQDAHGNASGAEPYTISFQVKNEATVSVSSPYPNPFHYKTNFEFTVTGSELPSSFSLTIGTINGKSVYHFSKKDAGDLHIGTNTVDWPGVDQQGNALPNGIYFFQLVIRVKDKMITKKGKLVLVR